MRKPFSHAPVPHLSRLNNEGGAEGSTKGRHRKVRDSAPSARDAANFHWRSFTGTGGLLVAVAVSTLFGLLLWHGMAAAFTEPPNVPYDYPPGAGIPNGSAIAPPLNTSNVLQKKPGKLTVLGNTTVTALAPNGRVASQQLCTCGADGVCGNADDSCINDWLQINGIYVRLQNPLPPQGTPGTPDSGFAWLDALTGQSSAFTAEGNGLVAGVSAGAVGESATAGLGVNTTSAGVLGIAGKTGNAAFDLDRYGVYGTTTGALSYSGFFQGQLRVNGKAFFFPVPKNAITALNAGTVNIDSSGSPGGLQISNAAAVGPLTIAVQGGGATFDLDSPALPLEFRFTPAIPNTQTAISVKGDLHVNPDRGRRCSDPAYTYLFNPGDDVNAAAGIVLGGACRNTWPPDTPSAFWDENANNIWPQDVSNKDLMLGTSNPATALFRVDVSGGVNGTAVVLVKGTALGYGQTEGVKMVIGTPDNADPYTCGDGVCTPEDGGGCPQDCTP